VCWKLLYNQVMQDFADILLNIFVGHEISGKLSNPFVDHKFSSNIDLT